MAKIKIYELAKEIDKQSKDIINYLKDNGVEVKSHMSNIEDSQVSLVKKHFTSGAKPVEKQPMNQTTNQTTHQPVQRQDNRQNGGTRPYSNNGQNNRPYNNNSSNYQGGNSSNYQGGNTSNNQGGNSSNYQGGNTSNNQGGNSSNYQGGNTSNNQGGNSSNYQGGNSSNYQGSNRPYQNNNRDQRPMGQGNSNNSNNPNNRPYNNNRPQGQGQRPNGENNQNRTNSNYQGQNRPPYRGQGNQGGYNQNNQGGYQNTQGSYNQNRQGGYNPNSQGQGGQGQGDQRNQNSNQGGYNRPYNNQSGGQYRGNRPMNNDNRNSAGGQNRPNSYNNNNTGTGTNRPYNNQGAGGNRYGSSQPGSYNNQNRTGGQGGYNNNAKPYRSNDAGGFNKDDDSDKKRTFRSKDTKGTDAKKFDAPIGMSRSDSVNNRNRGNKNTKNVKNPYNRKVDTENLDLEKSIVRKGQFIKPKPIQAQAVEEVKTITIPDILTIKELADAMKLPASALVKKLFLSGKMVSINQEITFEEAEEIAIEYEIIAEHEVKVDVIEELLKEEVEDETTFEKRPPVVCVMGHVDHGKTSLLDAIREANVTSHEAGGITQHIGAYVVEVNGEKITFLDTPGHEAFTSMRMRGAKSTDIAILVVAADDGVMPQTVEAISHAKAAGVQIIVAINKIDKASANIERVKQELTEHELVAEDWGGDTVFVPVSAITHEGITQLLEMITLTAELIELKANPNRNARGIVIEAELDKGRGPVATILVQKGTLHVGDSLAVGSAFGKVRAMMDDKGRRVLEATPSTPVEILGLNEVPDAGEVFIATDNEKEARTIAETYISQGREKLIADTKAKLSLDGLFSQIKAGNIKELNIIIKADVQGSVEAVKQSLVKLSNDEVAVRIIHGGVGAINESDVNLASASNAIIIGFNVRPDNAAKETSDREKVDLRLYRVIYNAIEDVEAAMKGMLDPIFEEKVIAHAEVRQVFKASGLGTIAGSYVLDGKITRGCSVRITREGKLIFEGALASLKRFKDDVKEVATGYECGLVFEKFNDIKEFDIVECYVMQEVPR
jgi:translation initiation factor IF-2